ncbi:KGK domain-containing protein [Cronbergia sp. UHCC 0137]|uniref:KGK domain-containing protein n=1 Tax=Cronbergia sp. UHCC 0137 TaxID=3110239 RepID=UPI002B21E57D|nr:KGK domain-containing protein [Cronbergia sp. UHCC 0137]MEA5618482.1 KGK domain-containing protein [Cronbergia sp. UHCC 0137]
MTDKFIPLECDDDIIQISADSFTVGRLKDLVIHGVQIKKSNLSNNVDIDTSHCISHLNNFKIYDQIIAVDIMQLRTVRECQLLKVGGKGWQKGRIKINLSILPDRRSMKYSVDLEFCPDEPETPESPLDDLRKSLNNE